MSDDGVRRRVRIIEYEAGVDARVSPQPCPGCLTSTFDFYKCEDCRRETCKSCTMTDGWERRVNDGVFLCLRCYRLHMIRMGKG
jgi:hypothetical protein